MPAKNTWDGIGQIGSVRYQGKYWILGVANLRCKRVRGQAIIPKRKGERGGAILISTHLPVNGPMTTEAIIHETLHVAFPKATESQVQNAASLVAKVLRKFEAAKQVSLYRPARVPLVQAGRGTKRR